MHTGLKKIVPPDPDDSYSQACCTSITQKRTFLNELFWLLVKVGGVICHRLR